MMQLLAQLSKCAIALVFALVFAGPVSANGERIVIVTGVVYPGQEIVPELTKEVTLVRPLRSRVQVARKASDIIGKVARRTLLPRRAIPVAALREAYAVEAGEPVRTVYVSGGLKIVMTGVALISGAPGKSIRVRNPDSGRIVTGVVNPDGTVTVDPL